MSEIYSNHVFTLKPFPESVKRLPERLRGHTNLTGSAISQLKDVAERNYEILQTVERDNRMLHHTQAVKSVKLAEWIPFRSDKGLRRFFRVSVGKIVIAYGRH